MNLGRWHPSAPNQLWLRSAERRLGLILITYGRGDRNVSIVPDMAVNGTGDSNGLADGLLGVCYPASPAARNRPNN